MMIAGKRRNNRNKPIGSKVNVRMKSCSCDKKRGGGKTGEDKLL